ncbi:MAG: type II toxin-antitoxin system VapC family toxin [Candidatus Kapabacteria bacterium]|nr:type II toxin-antitoxin system VapC family toxin [Ignavibacteriota bacterium]MCW5886204.1 type II toxin-antitoxin system VapC family toxin [Candidatus Kapabacteria bacterium]
MVDYLIDTNIIADYLGARLPVECLEKIDKIMGSNPYTSVICKIETLSFNFPNDELIYAESFFNYLSVLDLSDDIVRQTINIRRNKKIKTPDAIIASTAIVKNLILVTRNTKDFEDIQNLQLYNPWIQTN